MNAGTISPPVTTENKTTAAYRIFPYSSAIFLYKKAFLSPSSKGTISHKLSPLRIAVIGRGGLLFFSLALKRSSGS